MSKLILNDLEILRKISAPFTGTSDELKALIQELDEELALHPTGIGLSAIQLGKPLRIAIIRLPKRYCNLINPRIFFQAHPRIFKRESCLSFPGIKVNTTRFKETTILNGNGMTIRSKDLLFSAALSHEIDHMNGTIFLDRKVSDLEIST